MKSVNAKYINVLLVENDESDALQAKSMLEARHLWLAACKAVSWLAPMKVRAQWVEADAASRFTEVDKEKALLAVLEAAPLLVLLDLGLSQRGEQASRISQEEVRSHDDFEAYWADSDKMGLVEGFWLIRELNALREAGFAVPAIFVFTSNARLTNAEVWRQGLLGKGASWVGSKPFSEAACAKLLECLVVLASSQPPEQPLLSAQLAADFWRAKNRRLDTLWESAQLRLFEFLNHAVTAQSDGTQREQAAQFGMAYNTYRSWLAKLEERGWAQSEYGNGH